MKRYHGQCRCEHDASQPQSALPLWSGASLTVLQQILMHSFTPPFHPSFSPGTHFTAWGWKEISSAPFTLDMNR